MGVVMDYRILLFFYLSLRLGVVDVESNYFEVHEYLVLECGVRVSLGELVMQCLLCLWLCWQGDSSDVLLRPS
jgi:hypothetical protein